MDPTTNTPTIVLAIGILCVFLGVFGGGFRIKEISIPRINNASRAMGGVFGLALIIWSQTSAIKMLDNSSSADATAVNPVAESTTRGVEPENLIDESHPASSSLADKINELKPLWDKLGISNKDLLAEYLKIKKDAGFDNLTLIYKSEVNNKIEALNSSIAAVTNVDKYLSDEFKTLGEKVGYLEKFFAEDASTIRLSQRDKESLERKQEDYKVEFENSSKIGSANDFLTCKSIVNRDCSRSTSLFTTPTVWIWANVISPKNTEITLKWVNLGNGEQINSRKYTIKKSTGYRISASKSIYTAGKYEARLYNKENKLIARKQFEVH